MITATPRNLIVNSRLNAYTYVVFAFAHILLLILIVACLVFYNMRIKTLVLLLRYNFELHVSRRYSSVVEQVIAAH